MQCYPRVFGPQATLHNFGAKFFSVDLGTSQYLYIVDVITLCMAGYEKAVRWRFQFVIG